MFYNKALFTESPLVFGQALKKAIVVLWTFSDLCNQVHEIAPDSVVSFSFTCFSHLCPGKLFAQDVTLLLVKALSLPVHGLKDWGMLILSKSLYLKPEKKISFVNQAIWLSGCNALNYSKQRALECFPWHISMSFCCRHIKECNFRIWNGF